MDLFLDEFVWKYFEFVLEEFGLKLGVIGEEICINFFLYDLCFNVIKNYIDGVWRLYDKFEVIIGKVNGLLLKLCENKVMYLG